MGKYPLSSKDIKSMEDDIKARYEMALEAHKDILKTNKAHRKGLADTKKLQEKTVELLQQLVIEAKANTEVTTAASTVNQMQLAGRKNATGLALQEGEV